MNSITFDCEVERPVEWDELHGRRVVDGKFHSVVVDIVFVEDIGEFERCREEIYTVPEVLLVSFDHDVIGTAVMSVGQAWGRDQPRPPVVRHRLHEVTHRRVENGVREKQRRHFKPSVKDSPDSTSQTLSMIRFAQLKYFQRICFVPMEVTFSRQQEKSLDGLL